MCLIAFAIQANAHWPLVIASNRDEAHTRPTAPLARWRGPNGHTIVSGRDLRDGGAWLGVSEGGRVAMLTNVRIPQPLTGPRSRGELVARWLDGDASFEAYCEALNLPDEAGSFGGFNLVVGDWCTGQWVWASNMEDGRRSPLRSRILVPGIYGLSNAALDTPWPKTLALKAALQSTLSTDQGVSDFEGLVERLLPPLSSREPAPVQDLPDTGVGLERELALSSAFVDLPGYGTRCSAVIGLHVPGDAPGLLRFRELAHQGPAWPREESLPWPAQNRSSGL